MSCLMGLVSWGSIMVVGKKVNLGSHPWHHHTYLTSCTTAWPHADTIVVSYIPPCSMYPLRFLKLSDAGQHDNRIVEADTIIANIYNSASSLLQSESTDNIWLWGHTDRLCLHIMPLLKALEQDLQDDDRITEAATAVVALINCLKTLSSWIASMWVVIIFFCVHIYKKIYKDSSAIKYPDLTHTRGIGAPGRPKIEIDRAWLKDVLSRSHNISLERLSQTLLISEHTIWARIWEYGFESKRLNTVTDEDLNELLRDFKQNRPQSGRQYMIGHLRNLGYCIQRSHVEQSLWRIEGLGQ